MEWDAGDEGPVRVGVSWGVEEGVEGEAEEREQLLGGQLGLGVGALQGLEEQREGAGEAQPDFVEAGRRRRRRRSEEEGICAKNGVGDEGEKRVDARVSREHERDDVCVERELCEQRAH